MPNLLPTLFIALAGLALLTTLLWLWQSLREAFVHTLASDDGKPVVSERRAALLAEKQALLLALKDLESERDAGKLSSDDYRDLNEQYRGRARTVLRELDGLIEPHRSAARSLLSATKSGKEPAPEPAAQPKAKAAAAVRCEKCGAGNDGDAIFCKKCGTRLREEAMA